MKGFGRDDRLAHIGCLALAIVVAWPGPASAESSPVTVLSASGRREVPTVIRAGAELVAIEDVAVGFDLTVTSDARGGAATLTVGDRELGLYDGKSLASIDGDLRLLSAPARNENNRWLVPVDGVPRLLEPLLGLPVEWKATQRVLVLGEVSVPKVSVRTFASGDVYRVVFDASETVPFRVEQAGDRITVAIPLDLVDVAGVPGPVAGDIVESVDYVGGKDNTFEVRLGPGFLTVKASEQESPPRLVLDLQGEPGAAEPPRATTATPHPPPRPARVAPQADIRTVVIDPGHGGGHVGAMGPGGTMEKDVVLSIARRLRDELVSKLGVRVFLTRDRDVELDLDERTAIANNYKADLFISIHANGVRARGAKGSEVYFLSYQASDDQARRMAQIEGAADPLGAAEPGSDLALILWDMAQAEHLEESSALATRLQDELAEVTGSEMRGVKQAPFRVLVGATMPAVLVEVAFISNPEEEKLLASPRFQAKVAAALQRGISRYRREWSQRHGADGAASGRP